LKHQARSARQFFALGTASQVPTVKRNHNGYFLKWDNEGFLFDPGEGTQRQMTLAGIAVSEITKIFITHFHGDHCLGLPGILQRLSLDGVTHPVDVYFPASGSDYYHHLRHASIYHNKANICIHPIEHEGVLFADSILTISTRMLDHTVESWGYRFKESDGVRFIPDKLKAFGIEGPAISRIKTGGSICIGDTCIQLADVSTPKRGQCFAFVMDTRHCDNAVKLASEADMLVIESTYLNEHVEQADARGHLTAAQAASIAKLAGVKELVLTHFSQRYGEHADFCGEAAAIFPAVRAVHDGDRIDLQGK